MKSKRSRLAGIGILALVMSVTVGLVSGSVADAKKKKKGTKSFTVSKTTPTAIPLATPTKTGFVKIPIGSLPNKKFKGKIISFRGISVTTTFTGDPGFAQYINATLIGPSGRSTGIESPFINDLTTPSETTSGPTTETPNSATSICYPDPIASSPPCADPDSTLGPPYAGTIGNLSLLGQSGVSPSGTWFLKVSDFSDTVHATLNSVTVTGTLVKSLPTS